MPAEGDELIYAALAKLSSGRALTRDEAAGVMELIMTGEVTGAQFGALMMGLHLRGETVDELAGFAAVMRDHAIRVSAGDSVLDVVGTGGDRAGTFNISTTAAFVVAAAGAKVAKHGNRAASSRCGSADVLEALGADIQLDAAGVERTIERSGFGFMFAPLFHPAMKYAAGPRREMRVRTVFNILGPLTNPARATRQVVGAPSPELAEKMIHVLRELGSVHALVVHGSDGLDELTLSGASRVFELRDGRIRKYEVEPEEYGLCGAPASALRGGDARSNAEITLGVLEGKPGPARDVTLLNAAAGLVAADLAEDFAQGVGLARDVLDEGSARRTLEEYVRASNEQEPNGR